MRMCKILVLQIEDDRICKITMDALAVREDYYYKKKFKYPLGPVELA